MSTDNETTGKTDAAPAGGPAAQGQGEDLELVLDVPVTLQVQLGEAQLTVGDLLKCGRGSVISLNQKVGAPFRILLQKRAIAEGEVVEAGESLGIKITNVFRNTQEALAQGGQS